MAVALLVGVIVAAAVLVVVNMAQWHFLCRAHTAPSHSAAFDALFRRSTSEDTQQVLVM